MMTAQLSRHYKGALCKTCNVPVTFRATKGFCRKHTPARRKTEAEKVAISVRQTGKTNSAWKGEKVGLSGLHIWVSRNWGLAKEFTCDCGAKACDWANLGVYNRDRENWEPMCRSCHMFLDYKMGQRIPL